MKLDLIAIRKLSPAGLWDLAELTALVSVLVGVIRCGICDGATVRMSKGMLKQYRRELHARTLNNFNMRVKAWVLQCPERIAHVRRVIGETAIKKWRKNNLLDYAFTRAFGDWKSAFPNGLKSQKKKPARNDKPRIMRKIRPYVWKPFALVKIVNAERILYGQSSSNPAYAIEAEEMRAAHLKLWGVDCAEINGSIKTTQPRKARAVKPVRFTPSELVPEAGTGVPEQLIETTKAVKLISSEPEIFPPPKASGVLDETRPIPDELKPP